MGEEFPVESGEDETGSGESEEDGGVEGDSGAIDQLKFCTD